VAQITKTCIDCGETFTTGSNRAVRCPEHQKEHRKARKLDTQIERRKDRPSSEKLDHGTGLYLKGHIRKTPEEEAKAINDELKQYGIKGRIHKKCCIGTVNRKDIYDYSKIF
jgi:predicted  nucleic acid-binding Zn-ribbon protein